MTQISSKSARAYANRIVIFLLLLGLALCLLHFDGKQSRHGNSSKSKEFRLDEALQEDTSPSMISQLGEADAIKILTNRAKKLTEKYTRVFLYKLVHEDFTPIKDSHGSFMLPSEPPIPYSLKSNMPEEERQKHLSLMNDYMLNDLLGLELEAASLQAKQNGWQIAKSNRAELLMCLEETHKRMNNPYQISEQFFKSGYSAELGSLYWRIMELTNDAYPKPATDQLASTVEKVNQQYIDPLSGRMLVATQNGNIEWRPATKTEKEAVASFERIWRGIEDAHPRMDDPSTWDAKELNEAKQAFISLPPDDRTACRDYIVVRHRWNLQDMLDRWIWEATQK